ncbi:MAG: phosphonate metabolism transcriptional regulator PhnF [Burkholderiaceae bacterium]
MTRHDTSIDHALDIAPDAADATTRHWERIAAELRSDIASGRFAPAAQLPNESLLAQRFGVHRHTLRQAVRRLVHEGHLRVVQGRGTFVRELVLDYALKRRTRMTENLADAGERARRELLRHERAPAGEWAAALRLQPRDPVEVLHTRAIVRGRPIGLSTTVYPSARLEGIGAAFTESGSITDSLKALGVSDYVRASSTVSCRLPSADEADLLARAATDPVLVVQFHSVDGAGVPVEAGRTLFAADAVQLTVLHEA